MPQTPSSPELLQLHELAAEVKSFVNDNLMDFLEAKHTEQLSKGMNKGKAVVSVVLQPVEAFELEVKHKLSNAAHELLQAVMRIEDSQKQNSELDVANFLRYARLNIEEAAKDIEAANSAWSALNMYTSRIEKQDVKLATAVNGIAEQLINMLDRTKVYQKELYEKILLALNSMLAG